MSRAWALSEAGAWAGAAFTLLGLAGAVWRLALRRDSRPRRFLRRAHIAVEEIVGREADPDRGIPALPRMTARINQLTARDREIAASVETLSRSVDKLSQRIREQTTTAETMVQHVPTAVWNTLAEHLREQGDEGAGGET